MHNKAVKLFIPFILSILMSITTAPRISLAQDLADSKFQISNNPKYIKAKEYFYDKKFAIARVFLQDLIQGYPEDPELYTYLADCDFHLKNYQNALLNYRKANELLKNQDPDKQIKAANYMQIGHVHFQLKEASQAMAYYELAALTDSEHSYGYYQKGIAALFLLRNKELAIKSWEEFILHSAPSHSRQQVQIALLALKKTSLKIPPEGSPLSVKEALKLGGIELPLGKNKSQNSK